MLMGKRLQLVLIFQHAVLTSVLSGVLLLQKRMLGCVLIKYCAPTAAGSTV